MRGKGVSEDWSTWIIGSAERTEPHSQIAFCYYSVSQAVQFFVSQKELRQGVAYAYHFREKPRHKLISGLEGTVRFLSFEEVIEKAHLSVSTEPDRSDFGFVPCEKQSYTEPLTRKTLFSWAQRQNLPYVLVHDNDHVWFCNFPRRMEKRIFIEFLKTSVFDIRHRAPQISRSDWALIRRGLFQYGYTINRSLCSYAGGVFTYVLWTGTPEITLLRPSNHINLSVESEKLILTLLPNDKLDVKKEGGICPLKSKYGELE